MQHKESAYFQFLNIKYESKEDMGDHVELAAEGKENYDYMEDNDDDGNNIYITNKKEVDDNDKNITNKDHVHILQTNSNIE